MYLETAVKLFWFIPTGFIFAYIIFCFVTDYQWGEENKYVLPLPNVDFGVFMVMLLYSIIPFLNIWYIWKYIISPIVFYVPNQKYSPLEYSVYAFMQPKHIDLLLERKNLKVNSVGESMYVDIIGNTIVGWAVHVTGESRKEVLQEILVVLHPSTIMISGNPNNSDNWVSITPNDIKNLN